MGPGLRLFISAGEVSGDLYGAQLTQALRQLAGNRTLDLYALGGPRMAAAGARLLADTAGRGTIGFVDPLRQLLPSLALYRTVSRELRRCPPQAAVLIDYPGVNLPLARLVHDRLRIPLAWYLPPEEHLWSRQGNRRLDRSHRVGARSDLILTAHAQDTALFQTMGCQVRQVGHPLLDRAPERPLSRPAARELAAPGHGGPLVALFAASRAIELRLLWPVLAASAARLLEHCPEVAFLVPLAGPHLAPALERALARTRRDYPQLATRLLPLTGSPGGQRPGDLAAAAADLALCKAGSVTLELALAGVPLVMLYRIDRVTEWVGRHWLGLSEAHFPYIALPNMLLREPLVPEFKQHDTDPDAIAAAALALLDPDGPARRTQLAGFARLRAGLGGGGAATRAAAEVLALAAGGG